METITFLSIILPLIFIALRIVIHQMQNRQEERRILESFEDRKRLKQQAAEQAAAVYAKMKPREREKFYIDIWEDRWFRQTGEHYNPPIKATPKGYNEKYKIHEYEISDHGRKSRFVHEERVSQAQEDKSLYVKSDYLGVVIPQPISNYDEYRKRKTNYYNKSQDALIGTQLEIAKHRVEDQLEQAAIRRFEKEQELRLAKERALAEIERRDITFAMSKDYIDAQYTDHINTAQFNKRHL